MRPRPAGATAPAQGLVQTIDELVKDFAAAPFAALRATHPRVHCLTNAVAQAFTANVLLAAGAVPSMTVAQDEIGEFVGRAGALLVNLGTLDAERRAALPIALDRAARDGIPVVLDPVFADVSAPRLALARDIVARRPAVIRLNAAEFAALAGRPCDAGAVAAFARETGAVVALTGATDLVSDGARTVAIGNGHPLMAKVTAMGCAAGALIAAMLGAGAPPLAAASGALALFGVAGETAGETAQGPGSFAAAILDALAGLDEAAIVARARLREVPIR
jgi:hydroxyethylthiazole kinase